MSVFLPWITNPKTGERRQSKIYWCEFIYGGQKIKESAKTKNHNLALKSERERRKELETSVIAGKIDVIRRKRLRRVKQVLEEYQTAYAVTRRLKGVQLVRERAAICSSIWATRSPWISRPRRSSTTSRDAKTKASPTGRSTWRSTYWREPRACASRM